MKFLTITFNDREPLVFDSDDIEVDTMEGVIENYHDNGMEGNAFIKTKSNDMYSFNYINVNCVTISKTL